MQVTKVFDTYWRFAVERQAIYLRRLAGERGPWTQDQILQRHRFTNCYRASDRASQFLISEVQYGGGRSQAPDEVFFRTLLFKLFNKIETWCLLERELGRISWQSADLEAIAGVLDRALARGSRIYSAAYIMPSPSFGHTKKHRNHLALLGHMMDERLPARVIAARKLEQVYQLLREQNGLGAFLAFQFAIDLNYSGMLNHDEADFVVAGPGALDGISKCFEDTEGKSAEAVIRWVHERQELEFAKRGLNFPGLFGRPLQPIDCQNLFCEISKYARAAHPDVRGVSGRTRIKQSYEATDRPLARPLFPPRWGLSVPNGVTGQARQAMLL